MIHVTMATGNGDADAVNSAFSHNMGMVFQGAWDIVAPFVAAAVIFGLIVLGIRHVVSNRGGRQR